MVFPPKVATSADELAKLFEKCLGSMAADELSHDDFQQLLESGIKQEAHLVLLPRNTLLDLGVQPRVAGVIMKGRLTKEFTGVTLTAYTKDASGDFRAEPEELGPITHSEMQKFLTELQAKKIEVLGRPSCTPGGLLLEDDMHCDVFTRSTIGSQVSTLEGFNRNLVLSFEGTCKAAAVLILSKLSGRAGMPLDADILVDTDGEVKQIDAAAYSRSTAIVIESKACARLKDIEQLDLLKTFIMEHKLKGEGAHLQGKKIYFFLQTNVLPPPKTEARAKLLSSLSAKNYGLLLPSGSTLTSNHALMKSPTAMRPCAVAARGHPGTDRIKPSIPVRQRRPGVRLMIRQALFKGVPVLQPIRRATPWRALW